VQLTDDIKKERTELLFTYYYCYLNICIIFCCITCRWY